MSFYEYLRKLYIKELSLVICLSIPLAILLFTSLNNHFLGTIVVAGCIPAAVQLFLLNSKKNITDYKSLVLPRTIHIISYYIIIMATSLFYTPYRLEYLLFIPHGLSATTFHPFFGKKFTNTLFYFGLASAIGLFLFEYSTVNFTDPFGMENYTLMAHIYLITSVYIYLAIVTNERSKKQHKKHKKDLELQLAQLKLITEDRDELTYNLISDFRRKVSDMDADFELIQKGSTDNNTLAMTTNGRQNAQKLSHFIDNFTFGRRSEYSKVRLQHVNINTLIVEELNKHYETLQQKGIDLKFQPHTGDLFFSDKDKIRLIIQTLVQNAIDFADSTSDTNILVVNVRAESQYIKFTVMDDGVGISELQKPHVFKMFYSTKRNSTGASLYAAKKAAESLGGNLTLHSKNTKGVKAEAIIPNMTSS